jgi:hypothetical protein
MGHYHGNNLVENCKCKKVILEELMNIKPTLNFFKLERYVDKGARKA